MSTVWVSCLCSLRAVIKQIMDLQLKPDAPPAFYPFTITIAADSAAMKVADHLGALKRVSAAEPVHALLFAVAEAITSNQAIGVLQRRQWVYDIVGFKRDKEAETKKTFGSARIHQEYSKSIGFWAKSSEKISASFIDSALTVFNRLFALPAALECLVFCDEAYSADQNPFQSIYVLQAIVDRAKTSGRIFT